MGTTPAAAAPVRSAYLILGTLTAMNLLNYIDRYILAAVVEPVQKSLTIADTQAGVLGSAFLVSYTLFSPFVGWAGDRVPRKYLVAVGVGVWSLATFLSGWVHSYEEMLAARVVLGVGEASYAILAPGLIGDLFTPSRRNRALTLFYLAIPVGAALGYGIGGWIEAKYGWRSAFHAVGLPGLVLAVVALLLPEPRRGETELGDEGGPDAGDTAPLRSADYLALVRNRSYVLDTLGMAALTFALGGLQFWVPKYLSTGEGDPSLKDVTLRLSIVLFLSSVVGTSLGGFLADLWAKRSGGAYFWVPGLGMLAAMPFTVIALVSRSEVVIFSAIAATLTFGVFNFGPSNTILVNVTRPRIRAAAIAANLLVIHWLGDIPSIALVGSVSDWTQEAHLAAGPKEGLFWGLLLMVPAMALSGLFLCWGARYLQADREAVLREVRQ